MFIAGAQKSGTSSLSYYLEQHPSIKCHKPREISYFVRNRAYEKDFPSVFQEYYQDGVGQDQLVLAKSVDLAYIEKAAQRLKEHSPDCKIVMALRDPIDRAYSAYWHMRREGWETKKTFEKALSVEEKRKKKKRGILQFTAAIGTEGTTTSRSHASRSCSGRKTFIFCCSVIWEKPL